MRKKIQALLCLLVISSSVVLCRNGDKSKTFKDIHKKNNGLKGNADTDRIKRALNDEEGAPFWPNRGKRQLNDKIYNPKYENGLDYHQKFIEDSEKLIKEPPFWGNRGRRDSSSIENVLESEYPEYYDQHCEHCSEVAVMPSESRHLKGRRDDFISSFWGGRGIINSDDVKDLSGPFWGNRGKRNEKEPFWGKRGRTTEDSPFWGNRGRREDEPFWGNRGRRENTELFWGNHIRRQDQEQDPFWGNRGRRQVDEPFWGNRGRREGEPFLGNRGRRENTETLWGNRIRRQDQEQDPFWGNRGRRQVDEPFWGNRGRREGEPFWGNRGRRENTEPLWDNRISRQDQEQDPFWGNQGRRQLDEPFWGNRGRREEEPFWGNRGRREDSELTSQNRKDDIKDSIFRAMDDVETDIESLSRLKKSDLDPNSFWANRGRDSKLKLYFNGPLRPKTLRPKPRLKLPVKSPEAGTVLDNKMYVDEPNYILVERSSRSSGEDDPYYISRGKKYYYSYNKAPRDRRGAIEEIVKSVRNDPYYIARGKKDADIIKNGNSTNRRNELIKVKDLICSAIDLLMTKSAGGKFKREIDDNDRDRRTILKKLAAQLQMDPYSVSRGKKNEAVLDEDNLHEFINKIADKCVPVF